MVINRQEFNKYVGVGIIGLAIDATFFNLLILGPMSLQSSISKLISGTIAMLVTFRFHQKWTFNNRSYVSTNGSQLRKFTSVQIASVFIPAIVVLITHNFLQLNSVAADNISGNVIGLVLATVFRVYFNAKYVFN